MTYLIKLFTNLLACVQIKPLYNFQHEDLYVWNFENYIGFEYSIMKTIRDVKGIDLDLTLEIYSLDGEFIDSILFNSCSGDYKELCKNLHCQLFDVLSEYIGETDDTMFSVRYYMYINILDKTN